MVQTHGRDQAKPPRVTLCDMLCSKIFVSGQDPIDLQAALPTMYFATGTDCSTCRVHLCNSHLCKLSPFLPALFCRTSLLRPLRPHAQTNVPLSLFCSGLLASKSRGPDLQRDRFWHSDSLSNPWHSKGQIVGLEPPAYPHAVIVSASPFEKRISTSQIFKKTLQDTLLFSKGRYLPHDFTHLHTVLR